MRILDQSQDRCIRNLILYFTEKEVGDLKIALEDLMNSKGKRGVHYHISDTKFKHEITICIYDLNNLNGFDNRSKDLILKDE